MAFRTIVISNRCKLEYSMNYLICRKGNEETKILLDEIRTIIIDSTQAVVTTALISECIHNKIKIIFSDEKHNPVGEITPYQNNYYSYRKIKEQISFDSERCGVLWKTIIREKIINQSNNLRLFDKNEQYQMLLNYASEIVNHDKTNREGHAAKVYFNALFGSGFSRNDDTPINTYLNYGYSLILSCINREIKSFGYLTELGIHHIGESNQFNLSCDFIEPLRPLVDLFVLKNNLSQDNFKKEIIGLLTTNVEYNQRTIILENAIHLYVEDLLIFLKTGENDKITFIKYEL